MYMNKKMLPKNVFSPRAV